MQIDKWTLIQHDQELPDLPAYKKPYLKVGHCGFDEIPQDLISVQIQRFGDCRHGGQTFEAIKCSVFVGHSIGRCSNCQVVKHVNRA